MSAAPVSDQTEEPRAIERGAAGPGLLAAAFRLWRTRIGTGLFGALILLAVFGPLLAPHDPDALVSTPSAAASSSLPLGADALGRDVLSRVLSGGLEIIAVSVAAAAIAVVVGNAIGVLAGSAGRRGAQSINWLNDVLLSFPQIVLPLLFISRLGPQPWLVVLVVALNQFPQTTKLIYGIVREVYQRDFISVAKGAGMKRGTILVREIVPNIINPALVDAPFRFTYSIALVASLSFLGFGAQPPQADWGRMIYENLGAFSVQPYGVAVPVVLIALLTLGSHLAADGLSRGLMARASK